MPKPLTLACVLFFGAAYFAARFPDAPGASAGSYISTFLIAAPCSVALLRYMGARRAALCVLALSFFALAIETTGAATGLPYGDFYYGAALGPKLFDLVPYLLPVSYLPLVLGAVAASAGRGGRALQVARSAALLTLMDGVLDPGAVALGFWTWPGGGPYYGVPASNYLGWLLSGAIASALLLTLGRWRGAPPPGLLDGAILALAFWTGAAAFTMLPLPALLGGALLGLLLHRRSQLACAAEKEPPPSPAAV